MKGSRLGSQEILTITYSSYTDAFLYFLNMPKVIEFPKYNNHSDVTKFVPLLCTSTPTDIAPNPYNPTIIAIKMTAEKKTPNN